ncbi:unnamed protein product [[Actinomadura] parvosata subsp. kistnae]|uniref:hypothetical protein n=1 Tax=[Actinomadura] parvosata TaxID=1955412 RepID=UPI000D279BA5|nr:unnamed protein product [Actinomadura parvosata subsp. kistnae]
MNLLTRPVRAPANGRLGEPTSVVFLALLALAAIGWALVAVAAGAVRLPWRKHTPRTGDAHAAS